MIGKILHVVNNFCQTKNSEIRQCQTGDYDLNNFLLKFWIGKNSFHGTRNFALTIGAKHN